MTFLIIIIWLLLPLILIPTVIILGNKNSKFKVFLSQLLKNNRISINEFYKLTIDNDFKADVKKEDVNLKEENIMNKRNTTEISEKPFESKLPQSSIQNLPIPVQNAEPMNVNDSKTVKTTNSSNVLFGIGVCFVILSGIIFSTAVWFYISDIARTGIIALAAQIFFGLSWLSKNKLKLKSTSVAFFILGMIFSSITFVTAGYFKIFGQWFSVTGSGNRLFFAATFLIISLISMLAYKIYQKKIYIFFAIYPLMASATLILAQLSGEILKFSMLVSLFGVAVSSVYYYCKNIANIKIAKQISDLILVTRIVYGILSLPMLLFEIFDWSFSSWIICVLAIGELTFYGIKKNNMIMLLFQCLLIAVASIELTVKLSGYINDNVIVLGLVFWFIILTLIYRFYKSFKTIFSDAIFMTASFFTSVYLLFTALMPYTSISKILIMDKPYITFGVLAMTAVAILILITAFDVKNVLHKVCRVVLPLPFLFIAYTFYKEYDLRLGNNISNNIIVIPFIVCAALFIAISFVCKYAIKKDHGFVVTKYSFETISVLLLVFLTSEISKNVNWPLAVIVLLSIIAFIEIQTSEKNGHSLIPIFSLILAISQFITNYCYLSNSFLSKYAFIIASVTLCAIMTITSRLMFRQSLCIKEGNKVHLDTAAFGVIFSAFLVFKAENVLGYDSSISFRLQYFIFFIEAAVFVANLHRKESSRKFNQSLLTISSILLSIALIIRPFFRFEGTIIANKIILLIIVLFGFAFKKIWSDNKKLAKNFSTFVYMFTYMLLLRDALLNQTLANTLIVLITSLVVMLFAFMRKNKSWFILSAIGLSGLTIYMTKDFIKEIQWWVYLLVVGILLIVIAAFNEYFKGKGDSVKGKIKSFFSKWTW